MTTPDDMTLVIPLRAKDGMPLPDFYDYWLNAHLTMPARFPGIDSIWLHVVSFARQAWPRLPGVSHRPEPTDEFHGVPEATFPTMADLELFQASSRVHGARVERCIATKYRGTPTLAGVRGVAVADVIRRVGAKSQLAPEVSALFQPVPSA